MSFGTHHKWYLDWIEWASSFDEAGWGHNWPQGDNAEKVQRFPHVGLNGSLVVTLKLLFQNILVES